MYVSNIPTSSDFLVKKNAPIRSSVTIQQKIKKRGKALYLIPTLLSTLYSLHRESPTFSIMTTGLPSSMSFGEEEYVRGVLDSSIPFVHLMIALKSREY